MMQRFEKLIGRLMDMAPDADAMMVSLGDMQALLSLAHEATELAGKLSDAQAELSQVTVQRDNARAELAELRAWIKDDDSAECAMCAAYKDREFYYQEQLRGSNIRLEGVGIGAAKLVEGAAKLIGSFLPEGSLPPTRADVANRLGVYIPDALSPSRAPGMVHYDRAVRNLPPLPEPSPKKR